MYNPIKRRSVLLSFALVLACQNIVHAGDQVGAPIKQNEEFNRGRGTGDGGGGNSVAHPITGSRTLLDLAENFDKTPFDFNVRELLKLDQQSSNQVQTPERALAWEKYFAYNNLNDTEYMKALIGNDEELFIWALRTALATNEQLASGFFKYDTTYRLHLEAYGLKDDKIVKNVTYAMTEKELPDFGDTGVIQVSNPESKKQLAVQDHTGFVIINKNEFEKLDVDNQIALKLHETVLYLVMKFNPQLLKKSGTAKIREFVKNIMNYVYFSAIKKTVLVSPETVKKSYLALGFPTVRPDYSLIGKISEAAKDDSLNCELQQAVYKNANGEDSMSANYTFVNKDKVDMSGAYSMESDFFLKIQLHLVKKGICTFKPQPCTIKFIKHSYEKVGGFRLIANGTTLPDKSSDFLFVQTELRKKYQTARICQ